MSIKAGWAEPDFAISEPRIQKAAGFTYVFLERKGIPEATVGPVWKGLVATVEAAYREQFGDVELPGLLLRFIEYPNDPKLYDVQIGYALKKAVSPRGEAQVVRVKATLVVGILSWGTLWNVPRTYGPLIEAIGRCGYQGGREWREWHVYHDDIRSSRNSIVWVQHDLIEKD